jgi:hypothetical protein
MNFQAHEMATLRCPLLTRLMPHKTVGDICDWRYRCFIISKHLIIAINTIRLPIWIWNFTDTLQLAVWDLGTKSIIRYSRGVNNGGLYAMSPRIWLKIDRNVKCFLRISGYKFRLQISCRSVQLYKPRVCWILLPFPISTVRDLMHWTSLDPLRRDFAPRSELRRRIFGKFG